MKRLGSGSHTEFDTFVQKYGDESWEKTTM